jgi:hypothetical protein
VLLKSGQSANLCHSLRYRGAVWADVRLGLIAARALGEAILSRRFTAMGCSEIVADVQRDEAAVFVPLAASYTAGLTRIRVAVEDLGAEAARNTALGLRFAA